MIFCYYCFLEIWKKNPGPENWYSVRHPKMCGYFRTAIYLVFEGQKLLPKNEDDALLFVDVNDGFKVEGL